MRMRLLATIGLSALLATGLAGCGGDDDDGGGGEALELEEVPAGEGADDPDADEDEGDEETTTTTAGDEDDGDDDGDGPLIGGDLSESCQTMTDAATAFGDVFSGSGDIDLDSIAEAMAGLAEAAPDEIASDIAFLADAYGQLAEALEGVDLNDPNSFSDPEVAERLTEAGEVFSTPEFQDAVTAMTTFLTTECAGVELPEG